MRWALPALALLATACVCAADCACDDDSWCTPLKAPPRGKELFVFSVNPSGYKGYNWTYITTVVAFFSLVEHPALVCEAHRRGVRVITRAEAFPVANLTSASDRAAWAKAQVAAMEAVGADGINVDFESPVSTSDGARGLTSLVAYTTDLAHAVNPVAQVSFDVAWGPHDVDKRGYDYASLGKAADVLFVMGYDERSQVFTSGPCTAGPNAGLQQTEAGLDAYLALGIPADRLIAGAPWYGHLYPCQSLENDVCTIKAVPFRGCNCSDAASSEVAFNDIAPPPTGAQWDAAAASPFFNVNETHQMWYDNPRSLLLKYAAARSRNLAGVGMWTGDFSTAVAMWAAFDAFFL